MARAAVTFVCTACGNESPKWMGRCPGCGEWNTFHIVMKGDKVTIHLNDKLVVENTSLENYWQRGQPLPSRGPIELQHHGDPLWFKNIYLKELPD